VEKLSEITCLKCGGTDAVIMSERIKKKYSFWHTLFLFILLFIPFIGWVALFFLLFRRRKYKTVTFSICQTCGNKMVFVWNEDEATEEGWEID